jgi:hypothetical protein
MSGGGSGKNVARFYLGTDSYNCTTMRWLLTEGDNCPTGPTQLKLTHGFGEAKIKSQQPVEAPAGAVVRFLFYGWFG